MLRRPYDRSPDITDDIEIPVGPELPDDFDETPNNKRPESHLTWWFRPYLLCDAGGGYQLRCLDGGAWDRSTWQGDYTELPAALEAARELSERSRGL